MSQDWRRGGLRAGDGDDDRDTLVRIDVKAWLGSENANSQHTHVSEPREVACFSRSADRQVAFGSRQQLQRFRDPVLNKPLDAGFHTYVPKDESGGYGVEPVCACLAAGGFDVAAEADIVTFRNNLNKIGGCPYNARDAFEFDAVCVGTTVFLDVRRLDERPPDSRHARFMYMGYKFEAMCSEGVRDGEPVNANAEFCAAMRLRIGNHRIVLMAEIDAEIPPAGGGGPAGAAKNSFIELKTSKKPVSDRDFDTLYLKKYQKFFLQSYLAGIRTIFIGLRDDRGFLVDTDHVGTRSLHRTAVDWQKQSQAKSGRKLEPCWEPFVCINFIEYVSEQVRKACTANVGKTVRFEFKPKTGMLVGYLVPDDTFASRIRGALG